MDILFNIVKEFWLLLTEMAPYLLLGFLVAGLLSVFISPEWIEKHLGSNKFANVVKASLFGIPLPLCSCGVLPVAVSFHKHGASKASTTSFLISTPQTGIDSILVTYAILGPVFAIFRPIVAFITGILGGGLVQYFDEDKAKINITLEDNSCNDSCCSTEIKQSKFSKIIEHGFITLPKDIGKPLLLGSLIAAVLTVLIPPGHLVEYIGGGIFSILLMMIAGVPIYVCATASVPIAAGFIHMGASPGAALAFLIAGPATNAAAFATIVKTLNKKTAIIFLATVAVSAFISGVILDLLFPDLVIPFTEHSSHQHGGFSIINAALTILLLFVLFYSHLNKYFKQSEVENSMDQKSDNSSLLNVEGMSCQHCVKNVNESITALYPNAKVNINLEKGEVVIDQEDIDLEKIRVAIDSAGYKVL
ncbi:MAG: SO_0444 family Cu/Zn efflux transporter [Melioribacteraceae bacterium]|nr:SO_0444 family Cu/Zn efflux transporter [Melioribacteraceae bacterium]